MRKANVCHIYTQSASNILTLGLISVIVKQDRTGNILLVNLSIGKFWSPGRYFKRGKARRSFLNAPVTELNWSTLSAVPSATDLAPLKCPLFGRRFRSKTTIYLF